MPNDNCEGTIDKNGWHFGKQDSLEKKQDVDLKKEVIEKAVKWWERNLPYLTSYPQVRETYLMDFKQAMEEYL